jgi:opacity protein-like surface antigen
MKMLKDKIAAALVVAILAAGYCQDARADGLPKSGVVPLGEVVKASPGSWSGIYFGAGIGYQIADTNLSLGIDTPQGSANLLEIDGLSGRGWAYDGRIGVDFQVPNTMFVVGILGGYKGGETEFNVNTDLGNLGNVLSASMRQTWYAGGRVGIAHGQSLYYVGAAWTKGEMDISIPVVPGLCSATMPKGVSLSCSQDVDGRMLLAGMEVKLAPQWTLGMEYTLTQYDTATIFSVVSGPDSLKLNADTDVHAFMARFTYRPFAK